jgi:uncharacterized DUF497 family protein
MKKFNWNEEKNRSLKKLRGVSFEEAVFHIENDFLIAVVDHPNEKKYKGQKMYIVNINDYVYLVPFIESGQEIFLKTIIPSRKATKKFLGG